MRNFSVFRLNVDDMPFIAKNNVFSKILASPYNKSTNLIVYAQKFQNAIYLRAEVVGLDPKSLTQEAEHGARRGLIFEKYFISGK